MNRCSMNFAKIILGGLELQYPLLFELAVVEAHLEVSDDYECSRLQD